LNPNSAGGADSDPRLLVTINKLYQSYFRQDQQTDEMTHSQPASQTDKTEKKIHDETLARDVKSDQSTINYMQQIISRL